MKTITLYNPSELKESNPDGFEHALDWFRSTNDEIPWQGEIMDSFKAIFKASGLYIRDWSIDGCYPSSSYVRFDMSEDVQELSGPRAMAWLENNLLSDLRYKHGISHIKERVWMADCIKNPNRKDGAFIHMAGELKSCPFTGYCADDEFIEALLSAIRTGDTLGDAYSSLAGLAGRMFESEIEYQNSEENFLEQEHLTFTEDGEYVYS